MLVSCFRLIILELMFRLQRFGAHFSAGIVPQYCRLRTVLAPVLAHLSNLIVCRRQVQYSAFIEITIQNEARQAQSALSLPAMPCDGCGAL
jgi:hypothetical protein